MDDYNFNPQDWAYATGTLAFECSSISHEIENEAYPATANQNVKRVLGFYDVMRDSVAIGDACRKELYKFLKEEKWNNGRKEKTRYFPKWLVVAAMWPESSTVKDLADVMSDYWGVKFPGTEAFYLGASLDAKEEKEKFKGEVPEEETEDEDDDKKSKSKANKTGVTTPKKTTNKHKSPKIVVVSSSESDDEERTNKNGNAKENIDHEGDQENSDHEDDPKPKNVTPQRKGQQLSPAPKRKASDDKANQHKDVKKKNNSKASGLMEGCTRVVRATKYQGRQPSTSSTTKKLRVSDDKAHEQKDAKKKKSNKALKNLCDETSSDEEPFIPASERRTLSLRPTSIDDDDLAALMKQHIDAAVGPLRRQVEELQDENEKLLLEAGECNSPSVGSDVSKLHDLILENQKDVRQFMKDSVDQHTKTRSLVKKAINEIREVPNKAVIAMTEATEEDEDVSSE
ncbi:hypothetical protein FSARC_6544 [Fusarium sarcochroum]|uniref:Uncharacterized protein n=1 Tax=Fusarium sarcochroum TaxID=1208366 RepID=A0A8H4TX96_9HYPO|nr:hypothetical protein FSARC_6544 [Fusarium sarcochroum]